MVREATRAMNGGADPVWLRHCEHTPVLFAASLPPHSATEQVSLKKKKVSSTVPFVSGGNQTLKRPANRRSYNRGIALEATGNRLKPCGYYQLHRKGSIDLEKYKSDQGTSQK